MKREDLFLLQLRRGSWPETDNEVISFRFPLRYGVRASSRTSFFICLTGLSEKTNKI